MKPKAITLTELKKQFNKDQNKQIEENGKYFDLLANFREMREKRD